MSEKGNRIVYLALSLLLAIAFWLYVDDWLGSTTTKELTGIPVEFIGAEDTLPSRGLMLTEGEDTTMDVKLSGPRTVISGLDKNDLIIQVNLTNVTAVGTFSYPWTWDVVIAGNLRDKSGISLEKASLSTVTFQVSPLYSKQVPVSVNVNGEVADGHIYMAERLAADPSVLTLSGKEEDVDQVESARIAVDLTDANATLQREFAYELLVADGNVVENEILRVSDRRVLVTAPVYIVKDLALKVKFKESPGSKEENIRWDLEYDTITVAGEPASLENVSEILLDEIDLSKVLSDDGLEPLEIGIPAGCVNLSGFTTTKISIRFRGLDTRTFTATNITAVNISEGQIFSKMTNSVDVMLRGPASELDQVTPEDIRIVVDLAEFYSNGTFSSPAIVLVDGHDQVGAVGEPCTVAFKITS